MRVLIALLFSALLLIGMGAYVRFADNITPVPIDFSEVDATGEYSIDITLTFDVKVDPFSGVDESGLLVKLAGETLLDSKETIKAGTPIRLEKVGGIRVGKNEFLVFASPGAITVSSDSQASDPFAGIDAPQETSTIDSVELKSRALRIRIYAGTDPVPVAEKTLWSEQGSVQGTIELDIEGNAHEADGHDHSTKSS